MDEVTFLLADNPSECVPAIARWMRVRLTVLLSGNKTIDYGFISPPPRIFTLPSSVSFRLVLFDLQAVGDASIARTTEWKFFITLVTFDRC